ncbi:MAG: alpha-hydroxy-acid oxidizing protein, partial [Alphaproteobacteria bacterium]|nr:alpha-hydroxy-acid oxidizing protein [Alphaproteobacteria bacterium]
MFKKLKNCHNTNDFRLLAKQNLPSPIFHYIDGAADDEKTYVQNTQAFDRCDLVPSVLNSVSNIDTSVEILGKKIDIPIFLSPTALQRLFHHDGERAVGEAAQDFNTYFGISSLATVSIEEVGKKFTCPKMFQLYVHKDKALNEDMLQKCIDHDFDALAITVDTIVGGNRERDLRTGFTSPPKLKLSSLLSFAMSPKWTMNYLGREKFSLPQLDSHLNEGTKIAMSIG